MTHNTYHIDPDIIWKDADGTVYVLQPDREEIHALNETGTAIWRFIAKGYTLPRIKIELLRQYNVAPARLERDIREFVSRYEREKFIVPGTRKPKRK